MPNIWTHNLFGDAVIEHSPLNEWLNDYHLKQLYHLGCQGPDFLFYHRFLPWQKNSALNELGSRMHSEACGPVLMQMADTVANARAQLNDPLTVYIIGFMMHHVLDRNMHPYVFCKSGSAKWDHQRFEVILDTLIVRKKLGFETWANPVWKQIDIGSAMPGPVAKLMNDIVTVHYPDLADRIQTSDWNDAYRDMVRAQKLFHDPYGIKRALTFGQIEPLVYKRRNPDRDYLNEARSVWRHPAVEHESSNASFQDLWEQSLADGNTILAAAMRYWSGQSSEARRELEGAIGNRSYEHGMPLEEGLEIRFEEPIW